MASVGAEGFAESAGLRIHWRTFGAGSPLVLAHGWGSETERHWIDTGWVAALRAIRRVIALDVRGHGRSDKPREQRAYGYSAMSHDVLAVMDHLGVERADFFGYSMGSFMGVCLLGSHRARFTRMVLGGIGDETPASSRACIPIAAGLRAADPAEIADPIGRAARAYAQSNPTSDFEALALSALEMWPEGYPRELGGAELAETDIPVLVVNGAEDQPYVRSDEALVAAIPGARLVRIPGADHLTALVDPRFRAAVLEFLGPRP